jgi:hypothetical protein
MEWEYKAVTLRTQGFWGGEVNITELEALMNNLGRDGWELTSSLGTNEGYGRSRNVVLLFKRQRKND